MAELLTKPVDKATLLYLRRQMLVENFQELDYKAK